jgi:hypothetical protein
MVTKPESPRHLESRNREVRRRPEMDRKWTPRIEEAILDVIAKTGSPRAASKLTNVSESTISDHRKRDFTFRQKYAQAMENAFHAVLGKAFERSLEDENPSDRLIEVLLRLRWPERLSKFMQPAYSAGSGTGGGGLNPMVIARMDPEDRTQLINLLTKYQEVEGDVALQPEQSYDLAALPCVEDAELG